VVIGVELAREDHGNYDSEGLKLLDSTGGETQLFYYVKMINYK
jgi:hypothetical protein